MLALLFTRLLLALSLIFLILSVSPSIHSSSIPHASTIQIFSSIETRQGRILNQPAILLRSKSSVSNHSHAILHNTLTIDPSKTYQTILGFGVAVTDSATQTLAHLPAGTVDEVVRLLYSESGNKLTLTRVPIGSCDFSTESYSFDDSPNDFKLERFDKQVTHDQAHIIPFIQKAITASKRELKILGSPWSPPAWMKRNEKMTGSDSPCLKSGPEYSNAWANYYIKFIEAYASYGIDIWGLTVQNEPEFAAPWEACVYTPEEERDFVRDYLGPVLKKNYPNVKLIIYDHNKDHVMKWADGIYSDEIASKYIWGMGVHWYSGDAFRNLDKVYNNYPNKQILATEACHCPGVELNSWSRGERYAHDIIGDLNNYILGWIDWNFLLDNNGGPNHLNNNCDAPLIARLDQVPPQLHAQITYYMVGHFSRFIPPGSIRISHSLTTNKHNTHEKTVSTTRNSTSKKDKEEPYVDPGAASFSAPESADINSDNPNLEILTVQIPKSISRKNKEEIVIVILNKSDTSENIIIKAKDDLMAQMSVPAHSIHTLIADAKYF